MNMRGRALRKSQSAGSLQRRANNRLIEVTMAAVVQKEELKIKKNFGREALINAGGDRPEIVKVLGEYDGEGLAEETEMNTDKDAVVAMKAATWRLQLEIKKEKQQKEQLRLSQSKQVLLNIRLTRLASFI